MNNSMLTTGAAEYCACLQSKLATWVRCWKVKNYDGCLLLVLNITSFTWRHRLTEYCYTHINGSHTHQWTSYIAMDVMLNNGRAHAYEGNK